jgi:hypothetical protein
VDFALQRTTFQQDAMLPEYVRDVAAQFEARLIASRDWPEDIRVTGTADSCGRGQCLSEVGAHLQVRSARSISRASIEVAFGAGGLTFETVTNPTAQPCASGDTAHVPVLATAVGESGCLQTDQLILHSTGRVDTQVFCDVNAPTSVLSEGPRFSFKGADGQWLGQWATQHPNGELVLILGNKAVGIIHANELNPTELLQVIQGFRVQSQIGCAVLTAVNASQQPASLASEPFTFH